MRNGQNKRMRGRNRGKSHNPLTRVYESNGPDIKIRGTANHVAEKYVQLARDAQSSGDPVAAENYYQHAEHYFRMIAAVQEQFRQNQPNNFYRPEGQSGNDTHGGNDMQDESFDDGDDEGTGTGAPMQGGAEQPAFGTRHPQPFLPRDDYEVADERLDPTSMPGMIVGVGVVGIHKNEQGEMVDRYPRMYRIPTSLTLMYMSSHGPISAQNAT